MQVCSIELTLRNLWAKMDSSPGVRKRGRLDTTPEAVIKQIDAIIRELQGLRQIILVQTRPPNGNLTEQLYGALGQGSWDEYDLHLDWQRFAP